MQVRFVDSDVRKPTLLMLSHCVPDAVGTPQRTRTWQLLRLVSQSYQVRLAALADGPVSLEQWRAISAYAQSVVFEPIRAPADGWGAVFILLIALQANNSLSVAHYSGP